MTQESKAPSPSQSPPAGPVARATARVVAVIAVCLSLYQLYTAGVAALTALVQRSIHLAAILALTFLLKPAFARVSKDRLNLWVIIDWLLAAAAVVCTVYICVNLTAIFERQGCPRTAG